MEHRLNELAAEQALTIIQVHQARQVAAVDLDVIIHLLVNQRLMQPPILEAVVAQVVAQAVQAS
jgi:hypothetical protein